MLDLLPTVLSIVLPTITVIVLTLFVVPKITAKQIEMVLAHPAISRMAGALGEKSGKARRKIAESQEIKDFEAGMMEDLLSKGLPEIELLREFGLISDERMEWIKANPEGLMVLIERWLPKIQSLLKMRGGAGFDQETQKYDF